MLGLIVCSLLLTLTLGELYAAWNRALPWPGWFAILCLHGLGAMVLVLASPVLRRKLNLKTVVTFYYVPTLVVLIGSAALALLWRMPGDASRLETGYMLASVSLIPMAEEIVFRGGVSTLLTRISSGVWSGYFSALVFGVAHATPTWSRLTRGEVGLPVGAFLLGLCCEYLVRKSGSLVPAIAFHCACNGTVLIFSYWSPGWLTRLSPLYLG